MPTLKLNVMNIDYVPRHLRIGVNLEVPVIDCSHEIKVEVPVTDDDGNVLFISSDVKRVPSSETIGKFTYGQFMLKNLVKQGVNLKTFNMNRSLGCQISELESICQGLENAEQYVNRVLAERKAKESWLKPETENNNVEQ